jgi:hypothetical protein
MFYYIFHIACFICYILYLIFNVMFDSALLYNSATRLWQWPHPWEMYSWRIYGGLINDNDNNMQLMKDPFQFRFCGWTSPQFHAWLVVPYPLDIGGCFHCRQITFLTVTSTCWKWFCLCPLWFSMLVICWVWLVSSKESSFIYCYACAAYL